MKKVNYSQKMEKIKSVHLYPKDEQVTRRVPRVLREFWGKKIGWKKDYLFTGSK